MEELSPDACVAVNEVLCAFIHVLSFREVARALPRYRFTYPCLIAVR